VPVIRCPSCSSHTLRFLPETSKLAKRDYYRCDTCSYVWTVPKFRLDAWRTSETPVLRLVKR
jgi:hypothetical protein